MRVDLHVHTTPKSSCSVMRPEEAVSEAARLGLDAVCLTEHHRSWRRDELARLEDVAKLRVFGGTEITTADGDVLVFGLTVDVPYLIPIADLRRQVVAEGGILIAAHPYRGVWIHRRDSASVVGDMEAAPSVFEYVDAVEVCNGCSSEPENAAAARAAEHLGLPGVAGSDAHRIEEVGRCVTLLERKVGDVFELIDTLRSGSCSVDRLRRIDYGGPSNHDS
jgi:predicted metal-dependent phosphoesterase TrpH